ncbi:MAG: phosphoribosyl-ATP diphosphatase [Oscillospiraceae bacterium]|nr:phosphoribosyl-ATP diphosphatase [Oscillospiraceae bacterium]
MNDDVLSELYKIILERKKTVDTKEKDGEKSYTKYLFQEGINKILKKVGEECAETIIAAKDASSGAGAEDYNGLLIGEVADLFYHVLVMLAELDIKWSDIEDELAERAKKMGNLKEMKTVDKNT